MVSPGLIISPFAKSAAVKLSPSVLSAFSVKPELLIISATFWAVATLFNGAAASWASFNAFCASAFLSSVASAGKSFTACSAFFRSSASFFAFSAVVGPFTEPFVLLVISPASTSNFTVLLVASSAVSTTATVPLPLMKFTVSYGFTKSRASPLFCRFQPAFNTSETVAALLPALLTISAASLAVIGADLLSLPALGVVLFGSNACLLVSFTVGRLLPMFANCIGLFVLLSPLFMEAITSPFGTSWALSFGLPFTTSPAL